MINIKKTVILCVVAFALSAFGGKAHPVGEHFGMVAMGGYHIK